ncbi:MAG: diguanylate cyclase [Acidobacteriota bacterium]
MLYALQASLPGDLASAGWSLADGIAIAIGVGSLFASFFLGRVLSRPAPVVDADAEARRSETAELRRNLRRMERENEELSLFWVTIPDLVRQLNDNREKRQIAPILVRMLDVIFEPTQICIFYRAASGDRLKLVASKGVPRSVTDQQTFIMFAEGRIGWVAQHQMVMDSRDFASASSFRGEAPVTSSRFHVDMCAPMVDIDENRTMGVITVGGLSRYPRSEKKMIKMVADMGSMAVKNADFQQRIQIQANIDSLTGLYNKRFGTDRLALAINAAEKSGEPLSVFLFDIDHFKNYNDTNGHLAGDEVLREIGNVVRTAIRADDFAVRFGGEEFIIVLPGTDKPGALVAAEKIRRTIQDFPFPHEDKQPGGDLTVSGGIASFRTDSMNSTELLRLADDALYQAKKEGRNRVLACRTPYLSGETDFSGPPGA